jgi:hypothetical protein
MATITISFNANNNPTNGYIVKYRQVGTTTYTQRVPNPTTNVFTIDNLGAGVSYEGTIQGDCGNGQYGAISSFAVIVPASFTVSRDPSSAAAACANTSRIYTFYAAVPTLVVNTQIYSDSALTTAYTTGGYFSDGTKVYQLSSAGIVVSVANC